MFKQNKEFWLYFLGVIILFFVLFGVLQKGFFSSSLTFSSFPFGLLHEDNGNESDLNTELDYYARIRTSKGDIYIDLYEKNAPNTVSNFITLANKGHYKFIYFHRLVRGLLLQGGSRNTIDKDPLNDAYGSPGYTIPDEINWDSLNYNESKKALLELEGFRSDQEVISVKMGKYSVAMAGNGPDTSGSQFFIVLAENNDTRLDVLEGRHTVFGHVIGGFDVLTQINDMDVITDVLGNTKPVNLGLFNIEIEYRN